MPETASSDVFMLGCTFIEVLTACSRAPYDWLTGAALLSFRQLPATRDTDPMRAAAAAGQPYQWAVDTGGVTGLQEWQLLLAVVDACVLADPVARWSVTRVFDTLRSLHRGVDAAVRPGAVASPGAAAAGGGGGFAALGTYVSSQQLERLPSAPAVGGGSVSPMVQVASPFAGGHATLPASVHASRSPLSPATPSLVYDVLSLVNVMAALGIDAAAVVDAVGGVTAAPLDAIRAAGVPFVKCIAIKEKLAGTGKTTCPAAEVRLGLGRKRVLVRVGVPSLRCGTRCKTLTTAGTQRTRAHAHTRTYTARQIVFVLADKHVRYGV